MYSVLFNRKEVCTLSLDDLLALKQLAVFWGLVWNDSGNELTGRLSDNTIRIIGLNRKELNRLVRAMDHTQASLTTHPCDADLTLSIFKDSDSDLHFKIESNNHVYHFEATNHSLRNVSEMIYKRFDPNISSGGRNEVKIYWNPVNCPDITEWLAYLILQWGNHESVDILQDVPQKTFEKLLREVLVQINPLLSSYQLRSHWPELPSTSQPVEAANREPINPFKHQNHATSKINPFKEKTHTPPSTINPFKQYGDKKKNATKPFFKK